MDKQLTNCTIELFNGRTVHVAHSPEHVEAEIQRVLHARGMLARGHRAYRAPSGFLSDPGTPVPALVTLERSESVESRNARGFSEVKLNPDHIVGVFPLISRSTPDE